MRVAAIVFVASLVTASGAFAQSSDTGLSSNSSSAKMADLIGQGYEIKAAVPNGSKIIVFLQKGNTAYACEFANVTSSRCGSIN